MTALTWLGHTDANLSVVNGLTTERQSILEFIKEGELDVTKALRLAVMVSDNADADGLKG